CNDALCSGSFSEPCHGDHYDGHGFGWCTRYAGHLRSRRAHRRSGRSQLRGLWYAPSVRGTGCAPSSGYAGKHSRPNSASYPLLEARLTFAAVGAAALDVVISEATVVPPSSAASIASNRDRNENGLAT